MNQQKKSIKVTLRHDDARGGLLWRDCTW